MREEQRAFVGILNDSLLKSYAKTNAIFKMHTHTHIGRNTYFNPIYTPKWHIVCGAENILTHIFGTNIKVFAFTQCLCECVLCLPKPLIYVWYSLIYIYRKTHNVKCVCSEYLTVIKQHHRLEKCLVVSQSFRLGEQSKATFFPKKIYSRLTIN